MLLSKRPDVSTSAEVVWHNTFNRVGNAPRSSLSAEASCTGAVNKDANMVEGRKTITY